MFKKNILSIDIRDHIIKFAEGRVIDNNVIKISKAAYLDIKSIYVNDSKLNNCFQNGRITNCRDNINIIKNFIKKHKFKTDKVILSISDNKVITRIIDLPRIPLGDLNNLIKMEVPKYFPVDLVKYYVDYRILSEYNDQDKMFYKVLICAIPKSIIREYTELFINSGLKPIVMDVHENAVSKIYKNIEFEDIAIIDGSANKVDLIILNRGNFYIHTTFDFKIDNYSDLYRNESYDIENIKGSIDDLIVNVRNYINFYLSKNEDKNIDSIYITGDLGLVRGVEEIFYNQLNIDTFRGFNKHIRVISPKGRAFNENFYCANVGALLRGE